MRIAVDTNRYRDFCSGDPGTVELFGSARAIHLPFVVIAELRAGFLCGSLSRKNEAVLTRFLSRPRVLVLFTDEQTTHHYARIFFQLRSQGTPIPTNDIWIAALVLQHDLLLYSRNHHFDCLPQLPRISEQGMP
jgi:tRNA(fMet)-specific endonuclease VapC